MNRKILNAAILIILLSLAITGCSNQITGNTDSETNTGSDTSAADTSEPLLDADVNPALLNGNVLKVAAASLDGNFNPILCENKFDQWVVDLVFEGLVSNDAEGNPIPAAAKSWDISEDGLSYTFYLNEDIYFHDNTLMTAEDVAFTYYCMADPAYEGSRLEVISDIEGIEAYRNGESDSISGIQIIDDYTVTFKMQKANADKIWDFAYGILPEHIYAYENWELFKAMGSRPIGSGIMSFDAYEPGSVVTLKSFDGYHSGSIGIDGVEIVVQSVDTAIASLAAGQIDLANPSANLSNYDMMTSTGIIDVQEYTGNGYNYIGFNLRNPKLSDVRVRQALAYGLNRVQFIESQWEGFASVCNAPVSPLSWAFPSESLLNDYAYDPEKASALLDEAGWTDTDSDGIRDKDGIKLSLTWLAYNDIDWPINLVEMAKENWSAIGVELNAELMSFSELTDRVFNQQDFELYNMGWALSIDPDPSIIFSQKSDVLGGYNAGGYYSERAEEIFNEASQTYDRNLRAAFYQEWAVIANEELPYLFNAYRNEIWGVNTRVSGITLGPFYDWTQSIKEITLDYVD